MKGKWGDKDLQAGKKVESEHKGTYKWLLDYIAENGAAPNADDLYEHIAKDHLEENADYYSRLAKAGL